MRILWMSQHPPLEVQLRWLENHFGKDTMVVQDSRPFDNAQVIIDRFKAANFDEMVVVAPLSVLEQLTKRGIFPLRAQMDECDPQTADLVVKNRGYKFITFQRVKELKLILEEL